MKTPSTPVKDAEPTQPPTLSKSRLTAAIILSLALSFAAFLFCRHLATFTINIPKHPDEEIIATLAQRAVMESQFSANWSGFEGRWWSRPTYQFSPYTLWQSIVHRGVHSSLAWPASIEEHIQLARISSAVYGSIAAFIWFWAALRYSSSIAIALTTQLLYSLAAFHLQNCAYARVEAFLSLWIAITILASLYSIDRSGWSWIAALAAGVTIATKYNAATIMLAVLGAEWMRCRTNGEGAGTILAYFIRSLLMCGVGFAIATPEAVVDPGPLFEGMRFEIANYANENPSFSSSGFWDNNFFYWLRYFCQIGFGYVPTLCLLGFIGFNLRLHDRQRTWLFCYLTITLVMVCSTKTRYERNLELVHGAMCMAAADGFATMLSRLATRIVARQKSLFVAASIVLLLAQQIIVAVRLESTMLRDESVEQQLARVYPNGETIFVPVHAPPTEGLKTKFDQVVILVLGDPRSRSAEQNWTQFFGREPDHILTSRWSSHGYPFSSVDMYHGPARLLVFRPKSWRSSP